MPECASGIQYTGISWKTAGLSSGTMLITRLLMIQSTVESGGIEVIGASMNEVLARPDELAFLVSSSIMSCCGVSVLVVQ